MPDAGRKASRRSRESGYAYLLALFMIMALIIGSEAVIQNLATQGRRAREEDMIWRGNQYKRAIRIYYHKTGNYPQTLDDLKTGLPDLHFLRIEAYKDPMNSSDGEWRLIYVNAAGQIIGSVKYATLQEMAMMDMNGGQLPAAGTIPGAVPVSSMNPPSGQAGQTGPAGPAAAQGAAGSQPSSPSAPSSEPGQTPNPFAGLKPTGPVDGPVLGGFLTGVASKIDRPSVKVYNGGKKYLDWEFIWNPIEDQARALQQQGQGAQGAIPGQPGQPVLPGGIGISPSAGPSGPVATGSPQQSPTPGP